MRRTFLLVVLALFLSASWSWSAEKPTPEQAQEAVKRATFFFTSIATNGGYVGLYSADLRQRYGEATYEKATVDQIWVQPPGTPTVGECFLRAYKATGETMYLDSARAAGLALAWGQREEGGWDHLIDVSHFVQASPPVRKSGRCTFDDDISQGALTFLIRLDEVIDERWLTDAVDRAVVHLREAQFDNGAWPQWYPLVGDYHDYYTFNDNTINDCMRVMLLAHERYGREDCLQSAKRGGDFIITSQIPAPQSGWAQQYSHDMKPAWARTFEPIGVCSAVTARNIRTLIDLYLYTDDKKYLEPIPKALDWLDRSKLGDATWARFYELGTNRPIYGDRDGEVHYTLEEISEERRKGYSWQSGYGIPGVIREYSDLMEKGAEHIKAERSKPLTQAQKTKSLGELAAAAAGAISAQDERGRWIEPDTGMISCRLFVTNMNSLLGYIELVKKAK